MVTDAKRTSPKRKKTTHQENQKISKLLVLAENPLKQPEPKPTMAARSPKDYPPTVLRIRKEKSRSIVQSEKLNSELHIFTL